MPEFEVVLTDRAIADLDALSLKVTLQVSQDRVTVLRVIDRRDLERSLERF